MASSRGKIGSAAYFAEAMKQKVEAMVVPSNAKIQGDFQGRQDPPRSRTRQSERMVVARKNAPVKSMRLSLAQLDWELLVTFAAGRLRATDTMKIAARVGGTCTMKALRVVSSRWINKRWLQVRGTGLTTANPMNESANRR